jgi:hypothetical protein
MGTMDRCKLKPSKKLKYISLYFNHNPIPKPPGYPYWNSEMYSFLRIFLNPDSDVDNKANHIHNTVQQFVNMRDIASREREMATPMLPLRRDTIWEDIRPILLTKFTDYTFTSVEQDPDQVRSLRLRYHSGEEVLLKPGGDFQCFWADFLTCVPLDVQILVEVSHKVYPLAEMRVGPILREMLEGPHFDALVRTLVQGRGIPTA